MSNYTHLMLCDHKKTKVKMIVRATDSRHGHRQWIEFKPCCITCGKEIKNITS